MSYRMLRARVMAARNSKGFYRGYANTIADADSEQRYTEKLTLINGSDPYELPQGGVGG